MSYPRALSLRSSFSFALLLTLVVAGCSDSTKKNLAILGTILRTPSPIQGQVISGLQPLAGAHVHLLAASTAGYASESTSLLTPSILTNSPSNGGADEIDSAGNAPSYFVTTDAEGRFALTAGDNPDYACTPGTQLYLTATGDTSTSTQPVTLLAVVGECPATGAFALASNDGLNLQLTPATTASANYALRGFWLDTNHIGAPASESQSLAAAFKAAR